MTSDLTFITNENNKSLCDRLDVLLCKNTKTFDCLVGYFFISGFYKLYPSLENVERIRILVGLQTDRAAYEYIQRAKEKNEFAFKSHADTKAMATKEILNELEKSQDSSDIETGVLKFIAWLRSGKLEIRAYPTENLHAKVYIMTFTDDDRDKGRVITGSSNLTQAGLQDNLEFNVELKSRADYDFAKAKFDELWAVAVDVSEPYQDIVTTRSPFAQFTPYELYLKFLYEYFKPELNRQQALEGLYVPEGFKRLKYQEEAVLSARKILDEYGGVFLSDVVGLGKTYMAAMLAQQLDGVSLVIAPPHLLDRNNPGSWPNVFEDFQARQAHFESIGNLEHILERNLQKYRNVFIDESHRFRNESNRTYEMLAQICRGKRVILVSATPLNNTPRDILSQIKLFQPGKNSTIPNVRNLEAFFGRLEKNLQGYDRQKDREQYFRIVKENAKATREQVLKYLMIRRTRTEIDKYFGADLKSQNMKFPDVEDPRALFYQFNSKESRIFQETIRLLIQEFTFARYKPLSYHPEGKFKDAKQAQENIARFIKILLIKRLESSFHAFRGTIERVIHAYDRVIQEFKKGHVYISKKQMQKIFYLLDSDDYESIEKLLVADKAERLDAKDFDPQFLIDLENDRTILETIRQEWKNITRDPKWEAFRDRLWSDATLKKNKLIVFTESKETAEYLADRMTRELQTNVLLFSGSSEKHIRKQVIDNFDAKAFQLKDDYRILVATEVLSEGVNLHRSNVVINYDLPWNPTRLIQRVGRVNRVDTKFETIYTYNFFPTDESNDVIKLKEAAEAKIHAFIEMLGADARLLTEGEEIKSHDLFAKLNSKKVLLDEDDSEESELEFLAEIRAVRDNEPELFERVKRLPQKARSTKSVIADHAKLPALLTYFRQGKLDKFFRANANDSDSMELDFFAAARLLKPTDIKEALQKIDGNFYALLNHNKAAFLTATSSLRDIEPPSRQGGANDAYIVSRLKAKEIRNYHGYTDEDEEFMKLVMQLLLDGALPKQTTKKVAAALKDKVTDPLKVLGILRRDIPREFLQSAPVSFSDQAYRPREVILSSYLVEPQA